MVNQQRVISFILLLIFIVCLNTLAADLKYEAEYALLTGVTISTETNGYSGSGYVTEFDEASDNVLFNISVSEEGNYNLFLGYASPYDDKYLDLYANDEYIGEKKLTKTAKFTETKLEELWLEEGYNNIIIENDWGWYLVDYIRLEKIEEEPLKEVSKELVVPNPSQEAQALMSFLVDNYGKKILSGQQEAPDTSSPEFDYIKSVSGKLPAVRAFDLLNYTSAVNWHDGAPDRAIDWYKNKNGIVFMCWHWFAPADGASFYYKSESKPDGTTFDIEKAITEGTTEYQLIIKDIDMIAEQLKILQDEGVPVLWRPLHEAEGDWFWWGAKGAEPVVTLYKLLYDRLVNYHELNNLIWVWTMPTGTLISMDYYPGDEYVDIVGISRYFDDGDYRANKDSYDSLKEIFNGRKIIVLAENGPIPDPEELIKKQTYWSWFSTWCSHFILNGVTNSQDHIYEVYNHDYVITLDELPDLKKYPIDSQ